MKARAGLGGEVRVGFGLRRGSDVFCIDQNRLVLRCLRTYSFLPDQVVRIEFGTSTWRDPGVRIVHNRADYPRRMTVSCRDGGEAVSRLLLQAGFEPRGTGPAGRSSLQVPARVLVVALAVYGLGLLLMHLLH